MITRSEGVPMHLSQSHDPQSHDPQSHVRANLFRTILRAISLQLLCGAVAFGQAPSTTQAPAGATANLSAETNLVIVKVVVRDGNGNPVSGLKKEDFKLLDRGKEQQLSSFEEEPSSTSSIKADLNHSSADTNSGTNTASSSPSPRLVALFFDNLNSPPASLMQARDAADHFLTTDLKTGDLVAMFSSDKMLTDFTANPNQIHNALNQLSVSTHTRQSVPRCPDLSEYQAEEILRNPDYHSNAWQLAGAEIKQCNGDDPNPKVLPTKEELLTIQQMAQQLVDEANARARANLQQFEQVTRYIAHLPGSRTVVLVSPGFLSSNEQDQLDRIIDEALRSQVVINALDPKGLTVMMRELDASRSPVAVGNQHATMAANALDRNQKDSSEDALVELTQGTGGRLFHDQNDLSTGFASLAGRADQYVLAFTPRDLKRDGKFHELKVELISKQKGYTVSARHGYFATSTMPDKSNLQQAAAAAQQLPSPAPSTPTSTAKNTADLKDTQQGPSMEDRMRETLLAANDSTELPIGIDLTPPPAAGTGTDQSKVLSVLIHLDVNSLPFRQEADHSLDTVTFAAVVFDANNKAGTVKQRVARLNVTPGQLASLKANGLEVTLSFPAEPGAHRVRAVVMESEQHKIGSITKAIDVP